MRRYLVPTVLCGLAACGDVQTAPPHVYSLSPLSANITPALNPVPVADFTALCSGQRWPNQCALNANVSTDDIGTIVSYSWTWPGSPDGATWVNPAHVFPTVGPWTVSLTVTDSRGLTSTITKVLNNGPNQPPSTAITAPVNNASVSQGTSVTFSGTGTDPEDGTLSGASMVWTSSIDGQIGTGVGFTTSTLSVGLHTISLKATDAQGASALVSETVIVTRAVAVPPTASISAPANNAVVLQGSNVTLVGTGTDPLNGPLSGASLVWTSSIDGQIGTGTTLTSSTLSGGTHTITLTAKNSQNLTGTATITLIVNRPPAAAITAPAANTTVTQGSIVTFTGSGTDPEDGSLSGSSLVWTSSIDGQIGTGTSFAKSTLSLGTHAVTLTATDSKGAVGTATVAVVVTATTKQGPVANFTANCVGQRWPNQCALNANVSTDDLGTIVSWFWVWPGAPDGQTWSNPAHVFPTAGPWTVTLTVTDNGGRTSTITKVLNGTANQPPTPAITAPANNSSAVQGTSVSFAGSGTDLEDGTLTGASLTWRSSLDGAIGTGTSFSKSNLSVGTHTITLTATDSKGATGTVTRTITITPATPLTDEPVFTPGTNTMRMQDNMDEYTSATAMGAVSKGTTPRIVPNPSPFAVSQAVDTVRNSVIPGHGGSGNAIRLSFPGGMQTGAVYYSVNNTPTPPTTTHYFQYYGRVNFSAPIPNALGVKWFEAWHVNYDRVQWNTHDHLPCPTYSAPTIWQVWDQNRMTTCQGNQPVGPYFNSITDNQWHRFTYSYRPNSAAGARDGFARMWVDGVKVIDVSAATIGVTPPLGVKPWCLADDVDALAVADPIDHVEWGSTQTTTTPPWTYDIDDFLWWTAP